MPTPPTHLFLDAGNTLVHLDFQRVAEILQKEFGFRGDPAAMEQAEPHARFHVDWNRADLAEDRKRWLTYFWTVLSAAGWQDRARVPDAVRALFAVNQTFTLWSRPGRAVAETLERLHGMGFKLAVISNSDGSVEGMLSRLGLTKHLDYVIDSQVVGVEKPDRRIFDMALARSCVAAGRSVYVGDMFHIDVVGARGAGMDAILMDPADLHEARDCRRVREIAGLPAVLAAPA